MEEDKIVILGPNELPNLVGCKKLIHIEGSDPPRDDPKFEAWDDEDSLIMTWLWNSMTPKISYNYMFYSSDSIRVQILGKEKLLSLFEVFLIVRSEETQRSVMLDKGSSNTGSTVDQPPKENHSQRVVVENTTHITNDQDISRILSTSFMQRRKFLNEWVEIKENIVEHLSTLQLDQDIQTFSKEEMDRL
ncbi:hypothetical protein CR513_32169, partial [Mucuna pruriens]